MIMCKTVFACENSQKRPILFINSKIQAKNESWLNFVCSNSIWKDHSHRDVSQPFDLLAITNTTWQRRKAAGADSSDLIHLAPHSGQSSQLFLDAQGRNTQFLATLARSAVFAIHSESLALARKRLRVQSVSPCSSH